MRNILLLTLFFTLSCNQKSTVVNSENSNIDSIENEYNDSNTINDSFTEDRRLNSLNSIDYISRNKTYTNPTINLTVQNFFDMKKSDIVQIEDFLISNNWVFKSKKIGDPENSFDLGDVYVYQNFQKDSELTVSVMNNHKTFFLYTLNPFNFKRITNQLNELGFTSNVGNSYDTPRLQTEYTKNYVGEIVPVDFNTKIYKKREFKITSTSYINGIVDETYQENDNTYTFKYDPNNTFNSFGFSF